MHDDDLGDDDDGALPGAGSRHPLTLCSLIIIRNRPEYTQRSAISSYALFTVKKVGEREARFDIVHRVWDRDDTRAEIIDGLAELIPAGSTLLVRHPPRAFEALRQTAAGGDVRPPNDTQLILRRVPGLRPMPFTVPNSRLIAAGQQLGLDMALRSSTPIKRRRRAPLEAMALWGLYTNAFCRPAEARALIAAFHAWQAIERAKPLPF
jgi:hypothetical protein